jgi:hypothetical protein
MAMLNKFSNFSDEEDDTSIDSNWTVTVMLCWSQYTLETSASFIFARSPQGSW